MRLLIQRVKKASVVVDNASVGCINQGILAFLAVHKDDSPDDTKWLVNKLMALRIFADEHGKMNRSLQDVQGEILVISQFTLYGNCTNGRRPDFLNSAQPEKAQSIYNKFVDEVKEILGKVQTGVFGAHMEVSLINDGPVTFILDGQTK